MRPPKYWIEAVIKKPGLVKWYFHWQSSLDGKQTPLKDNLPWINYAAIDWLSRHLTKEMIVFEWGSGGSTAFFSRHAKQVVTIEHDPIWYQEVVKALDMNTYGNVNIHLVAPEKDQQVDLWSTSTDVNFQGYSFEKYIMAIRKYSDGFFDLVAVDGRARLGCISEALLKVKRGGYLMLDNSDRAEYQHGIALLRDWRCIPFFGPGPYVTYPSGTTFWQKHL